MKAPAVVERLPSAYAVRFGRRGVLACLHERCDDLDRAGFLPDGGGGEGPSDLSGRGPLGEIRTHDGLRLVVRAFRHGGLLRWLTGTRYANPERPFEELLLAESLRSEGLATPRVVAARAVRLLPFGWSLDLVTERVEHARDLAQVLEALRAGQVPEEQRRRLARLTGRLIGRLHAVGFRHADLQPRNLIVQVQERGDAAAGENAPPERLWVLDLEGSARVSLDAQERAQNLSRFVRAVLRREARGDAFLSPFDGARFAAGYCEGLGSREQGKEVWRRVRSLAERGPGLGHRLGWFFEERLGRLEKRDGEARVSGS